MVCRENPASSIAIALARSGSWLDDAQVQSVVHQLRHEFSGHQPPNGWDRDDYLARELRRSEQNIDTNPNFRPDRRAGLRRRLARAHEQTGGLRDDIIWAMSRLPDGVQAAQAALEARLAEFAGQQGMSLREARAQFLALRAQAPAGRQPRATAPETRDLGVIPGDPATRYALRTMSAGDPVLPPVRLVQHWIPVRADGGDGDVTHVGVSTLSDRIELRHRDGSTVAYRMSRTDIDELVARADRQPLDQHTVDRVGQRGERIARGEQTAYAVRCDECGEFVGDTWHYCRGRGPVALVPLHDHVDGASRLSAPDPRQVADLIAANHGRPVQAPVRHLTQEAQVEGTVLLRPGLTVVRGLDRTTRQRVDLDDAAPGELTCATCYSTDCRHVAHTREAVREHLQRAGQIPQQEVSEALHALGITVRTRAETAEQHPPLAAAATSFLSNPEAFRQAVRDSGPEHDVPFHSENALQGYAAGSRFGIEIEFNAANTVARGEIARELVSRGILSSARQDRYHGGLRGGYTAWVYESDCSVPYGGELVTPVMSDTAEHWGQLATVCDAIRRHGGTTDYAGSHTNISSAGYTPEMAWRLVNLVQANEDDIYRMGRTRRSPRSTGYNHPLNRAHPGPRWVQSHQATVYQGGREAMVNFFQAFSGTSGRIEWRFPDASHDQGVIQAQVSLCAALTNYVRTQDVPPSTPQPLHSARTGGWARHLMAASESEFADRTRPIRTLIDTLFDTDRNRRQIAALWGRGSYYRPR